MEEMRQLRRSKCRWKDNIKIEHKEIGMWVCSVFIWFRSGLLWILWFRKRQKNLLTKWMTIGFSKMALLHICNISKVNLFLCLTKYHAMKTYGLAEV
jgi:hypothetical protein